MNILAAPFHNIARTGIKFRRTRRLLGNIWHYWNDIGGFIFRGILLCKRHLVRDSLGIHLMAVTFSDVLIRGTTRATMLAISLSLINTGIICDIWFRRVILARFDSVLDRLIIITTGASLVTIAFQYAILYFTLLN